MLCLSDFPLVRLFVRVWWCLGAGRCYCKASKVLQQYEHMPSFHGIQQDCQVIVQQLRARLMQQFHNKDVCTAASVANCFFTNRIFFIFCVPFLFFIIYITNFLSRTEVLFSCNFETDSVSADAIL